MEIVATFLTEHGKKAATWTFDSKDFPPNDKELKEVAIALSREIHYAVTNEVLPYGTTPDYKS